MKMTKISRRHMAIMALTMCLAWIHPALNAQSDMLTLLRKIKVDEQGPAGACDGCTFSTRGDIVAASDNTGLTKLFKVSDGSLISVIKHNEGEVAGAHGETNVIHFTNDDRYVLTGMNQTGCKIWETKSGKLVKNLGHGQNTDGAAFSPDGRWIAVAHDRFCAVYTLWDYEKVAEYSVPRNETNSVDWASDASLLVLGGDGHSVQIVRTRDWKLLHDIRFPGDRVKTVRISPNNDMVAACGQLGVVRIYRVTDGQLVAELWHNSTARCLPGDDYDGEEPNVEAVEWSADGSYIFTGGVYDGVLRVWRVADWSLVGWAHGQQYSRQVETLAVSADNMLASGGDEGYLYLYQFDPPLEKDLIAQLGEENIIFEAEDFDANVPQGGHWWSVIDDETASGMRRVQCFPDLSDDKAGVIDEYMTWDPMKDSPKLDYRIHFTQPGVYHVWARGKAYDHYGNSFHVGLNGEPLSTADKMECLTTPEEWVWANATKDQHPATIEIKKAGPATLNIWVREDGMELDKLILTTDSNFLPEGIGPAPTPRR